MVKNPAMVTPAIKEPIRMTDTKRPSIVKLGDTDQTVSDPAEDIRGRKVFDKNGEEIGKVEALMIDDNENKVRFLQVSAGGFLGIGDHQFLIPVDAVTRIGEDDVHVDQTRERVSEAPKYDPAVVQETDYYASTYGHYGLTPFWGMGYAYPAYPYYR